jgi:hypothetical protein
MPDISAPILSVNSIKGLLLKEIQNISAATMDNLSITHDSHLNMIRAGRDHLSACVHQCTTYEDCDGVISELYCMDLYEWTRTLGGQYE